MRSKKDPVTTTIRGITLRGGNIQRKGLGNIEVLHGDTVLFQLRLKHHRQKIHVSMGRFLSCRRNNLDPERVIDAVNQMLAEHIKKLCPWSQIRFAGGHAASNGMGELVLQRNGWVLRTCSRLENGSSYTNNGVQFRIKSTVGRGYSIEILHISKIR